MNAGAGASDADADVAVLAAEGLVAGAPGAPGVGPWTLTLGVGAALALRGPSGAGKSSLLRVLALTRRPRAGTLRLWGEEVGAADDAVRAALRRLRLCAVHEGDNLVPTLDVAANVALQAALGGGVRDDARLRAALAAVELEALAHRPARALSHGEAARAAVARLVYQAPALALADEPTAALDRRRAELVGDALTRLRRAGTCVVVATHDDALAATLSRPVTLDAALGGNEAPGAALWLGTAGAGP